MYVGNILPLVKSVRCLALLHRLSGGAGSKRLSLVLSLVPCTGGQGFLCVLCGRKENLVIPKSYSEMLNISPEMLFVQGFLQYQKRISTFLK